MTLQAQIIHSSEVPLVWHKVKPFIDKALIYSNGEMVAADVLSSLLNKELFLFIGLEDDEINSALIAELVDYPRKRVFRILTWAAESGYDFKLWMNLLNFIEDFARTAGCEYLEAWVRKGLVKRLKWDHERSVVTKKL